MSQLAWVRKGSSMQLCEGDRKVAVESEGTLSIAGTAWTLSKAGQELTASSGEVTYSATAEKSFKHAKEIRAKVDGRDVLFVNEQKSDWVIEENDIKLAQFTGANHGVRNVVVDVEPDAALTDPQRAFLAWVARIALEERMVGSTWILTLALILLAPILIFFFVF